ncbi:sensor protein hoxX (plasmid) [Mycetohabitans rhizoxinica]
MLDIATLSGGRLDILLFASAYNGMVQRVHRELVTLEHRVCIELSPDPDTMLARAKQVDPDLIICPFLKHRIPDTVWRAWPCLVVHPGIEGDRGPSALDWAITHQQSEWGVTLLQANTEMDGGDVWGTHQFAMRRASKGSIYRRDVIPGAVKLIRQALADFADPRFRARAQDYARPSVKGRPHVLMRQDARRIDWSTDDTDTIVNRIHAADGFPGVRDEIHGQPVYLFGAVADTGIAHEATPGAWLGQRHGAVCRATRDGAVWIKQMKAGDRGPGSDIKLPSMLALRAAFDGAAWLEQLPELDSPAVEDIRIHVEHRVAYVEFDFHNGAMSTSQCTRLTHALDALSRRHDVRVIVLMGGNDFWSNGIHLHCIEASPDPAGESWRNINAINDLVRTILLTERKITIAALRNNAGAGGAIMPLACDFVLARRGVVLNPHYQTMGLYGSEYWTYLLPRRTGAARAKALVDACLPVVADEALDMNLVDHVLPEDWTEYHALLLRHCQTIAQDERFSTYLNIKARVRSMDERRKPLQAYRDEELQRMKAAFDDPGASYHALRHQFVHKIPCAATPPHLRGDVGMRQSHDTQRRREPSPVQA